MPQKSRPKGTLRNEVFLMMALVSIVPILIAGFLSVYSINISHRVDVANLEGALLNQKYREISSLMQNAEGVLGIKFLSDSADYAAVGISDKKNVLKNQIFSGNPSISDISEVSPAGWEIARFNKSYPNGVADADLRNLSSAPEFSSATNGTGYVSPVRFTEGGPVVTIAEPVLDKSNIPTRFVVIGEFKLNGLGDILRQTQLGDTGYLYLVDSGGNLIGGGLKSPPATNLNNIALVSDVISGRDSLGPSGERRYKNYFGEDVVAAGKYISEYKWGLIAEWPVSEADQSVKDILYKNIVVSVGVLVAVIIVSILLATLIVRPIRKLEKGTELVAQGKFEEKVKIDTGDELEELGDAFNKMTEGLKQLQELKDEFVFIAAHELRTPVAAMKGYLSLILDGVTGPVGEKTKDFVLRIINSNERLIQLVNDLLEVSRSEAGKLAIKVAPTDPVGPVDSALNELRPLADEKRIELSYEVPAQAPKIMADADRLKEVMVNLVGNAIKYNNAGGWVKISHELTANELITHIADNGFGISPEAQAKLFEKFYRVQTDKTRDITGTGLGLFIVRQIVEKMGGKIWAESEGEGKGSTFGFSLPLA